MLLLKHKFTILTFFTIVVFEAIIYIPFYFVYKKLLDSLAINSFGLNKYLLYTSFLLIIFMLIIFFRTLIMHGKLHDELSKSIVHILLKKILNTEIYNLYNKNVGEFSESVLKNTDNFIGNLIAIIIPIINIIKLVVNIILFGIIDLSILVIMLGITLLWITIIVIFLRLNNKYMDTLYKKYFEISNTINDVDQGKETLFLDLASSFFSHKLSLMFPTFSKLLKNLHLLITCTII